MALIHVREMHNLRMTCVPLMDKREFQATQAKLKHTHLVILSFPASMTEHLAFAETFHAHIKMVVLL